MDIRYRYEDGIEQEGLSLRVTRFKVIKKTPKGAWVQEFNESTGAVYPWCRKRFVLDGYGKRYCHPTKELAFASYKKRKEYQLSMAKNTIKRIGLMLEKTEGMEPPEGTLYFWDDELMSGYILD